MGRLVLLLAAVLTAASASAAPRCDVSALSGLASCVAKATKALRRCTTKSGALCQTDAKATGAADRLASKLRKRCDAAAITAAGYPPPADPAFLAARLRQTCLGNAAALVARGTDASTDARCADVLAASGATVAVTTFRERAACLRQGTRCDQERVEPRLRAIERRAGRKSTKRCGDGVGQPVVFSATSQADCAVDEALPNWSYCARTSADALVDLWGLAAARPHGSVAGQISSYDRSGGNLDFGLGDDAAPFLAALGLPANFRLDHSYLGRDGERFVVFDESGPGVVWRIWMTGIDALLGADAGLAGDIAFHLDDEPTPRLVLTRNDLFSGTVAPFLAPLAGNQTVSSGGFYAMTPIPFARRLRITTSHVPHWLHVSFSRLPQRQAVASFDPTLDVSAVAAQLAKAGDPSTTVSPASTEDVAVSVAAGATQALWSTAGAGTIVRFELLAPAGADVPLGLRLRGTFDDQTTIDAPVDELFGSSLGGGAKGFAFGRDGDRYYCYFPMPYATNAAFELRNDGAAPVDGWTARIGTVPQRPNGPIRHLYAMGRSASLAPDGRDYLLADVAGTGHVVGVALTSGCGAEGQCQLPTLPGQDGTHLEGDERITIDDNRWPQIHGTGLEDFFSGGFYYVRGAFGLPTHGNPAQAPVTSPRRPGRNLRSSYRVLLGDTIPFSSRLHLAIEHGGENDVPAEMSSVVYWYGAPAATLVASDHIDVGDPASEATHALVAEGRTDETLDSRFRGDDSNVAYEESGMTASVTRFEVSIEGMNNGVRLRRLTALTEGGQRARVSVDGAFAGIWQTSEVNTVLRWAEVEFEVPAVLTAAKHRITVEIDATASPMPWHAFDYTALSQVP